ncbi:hypothetical protein SAMN06264941_0585 [Methanohalophilus portucalensis FDF-1]|uniref:Uncharacterized protein n=1 Tax=Methanohalophilus portucalensis FDF-1 TaxID=523843 RepID=A0A1X7N6D1_9EURY|nr:hypothetical protein SAMN06264941_0585 [Methanohalophilus portucalensis FDF-1]
MNIKGILFKYSLLKKISKLSILLNAVVSIIRFVRLLI